MVRDGEIVAIRYAAAETLPGATSTGGIALSIPVEYFAEWLGELIAG